MVNIFLMYIHIFVSIATIYELIHHYNTLPSPQLVQSNIRGSRLTKDCLA